MVYDEEKILQKIATLEDEHRALDAMLSSTNEPLDQLSQKRMKKRKLWLKDEIARLYDLLHPDIIA